MRAAIVPFPTWPRNLLIVLVSLPFMAIIQSAHNLRKPHTEEPCPYGIRISLKTNDPFRKLLGPDWHRAHWYRTADERDDALLEMARRHEYSRPLDSPTLVFTKIENLAASRGLS
jgi:hypothetical protein